MYYDFPFTVSHGRTMTTGFKFKDMGKNSSGNDVVYTPDIGILNQSTQEQLKDVHIWIVNCDTLEKLRDSSHSY